MLNRRCLAWSLPYLLFAGESAAQLAADPTRRVIECSKLPRCVAAVTSAQKAAESDKHAALGKMWIAYASFPDPRLLCELGHLYQQTGQQHEAANQYRLCLDSGVPLDPGRRIEASNCLGQAEKDGMSSPLPNPVSQSPEPAPPPVNSAVVLNRGVTNNFKDGLPPSRPVWRIILGSVLAAGGLLPLGFGAAALSQNGQCYQSSSAMVSMPPCLQTLNTGALGGGLLIGGLLVAASGVLTIAIPAHRFAPIVLSPAPSTAGLVAY